MRDSLFFCALKGKMRGVLCLLLKKRSILLSFSSLAQVRCRTSHQEIKTSFRMNQALYEEIVKDTPDLKVVRQCIRNVADVLYKPDDAPYPILHYCILKGDGDALKVLLETSQDIDFTVVGWREQTPLHSLCLHFADELPHTLATMKEMTTSVVRRLESHSSDRVDWRQKDANHHDFLSLAAREGVLSDLFSIVKFQLTNMNDKTPFILTYKPPYEDWTRLSEDDHTYFNVPNEKDDSTQRLYDEVKKDSPNLVVIKHCISCNADVLYNPGNANPTLHWCILKGHADALEAMLDTMGNIDFTVEGVAEQPPFHCVCLHFPDEPPHATEEIVRMTTLIIKRLESHPSDQVNWGQKNRDGNDFLTIAARRGVLADLYPLVKTQPYYAGAPGPQKLMYMPSGDDWERLSKIDQRTLQVTKEGCSQALFDEIAKKDTPNLCVVRRCINGGADVLFAPPYDDDTTLHYCMLKSQVEALNVLLETTQAVDFRVKDNGGQTPLHCVSLHWAHLEHPSPEAMTAMTTAIVNRLATHPTDLVDWGSQDEDGDDFVSLAAMGGVLSYLYPIIKNQPYYVKAKKPFLIQRGPTDIKVWNADWKRLSPEDRTVFKPSWG